MHHFYNFSAQGRGRGVRGARTGGFGFFIEDREGRGGVSQERRGGGRRAGRVSVGDLGVGGSMFFLFGAKVPTKITLIVGYVM